MTGLPCNEQHHLCLETDCFFFSLSHCEGRFRTSGKSPGEEEVRERERGEEIKPREAERNVAEVKTDHHIQVGIFYIP